jgi:hypothetical protein
MVFFPKEPHIAEMGWGFLLGLVEDSIKLFELVNLLMQFEHNLVANL